MARERRKVKLVTASPPAPAFAAAIAAFPQSCKVYVISICDWKLSLCGRGDGGDENADLQALPTASLPSAQGYSIAIDIGNIGHAGDVLDDTVLVALVCLRPAHLIQVMFPLVKLYGTNKTS